MMGFKTENFALLVFGLAIGVVGLDPTLISPCPSAFIYRFQDTAKNTWYGTFLISSDSDAYIVQSIRILLDSEVVSLKLYDHKNSAVTVDTLDNTEFLIEGLEEKIRKTSKFSLTVAITYKPFGAIPKLTAYRVNEFTVCSHSIPVGGTIATSTFSPPITRPPPSNNVQSPWTSRPPGFNLHPTPLPTPTGEVACGTRVQAFTPLIVGGKNANRGEWPWHGALFALEDQNTQYRCGVTLVTRRHAVTASHCVCLNQRTEEPLNPNQLFLVFGRMMLFDWGDSNSQSIRAKHIIVHPGYNSTNLKDDIAVIKMEEPIKITAFVRPICLWPAEENADVNLLAKKKGTIVGWGFTIEGKVSETLQHAEIPVIDAFKCVSSKTEFYLQYLTPKSFCAGSIASDHSQTVQACNGDSGGGMVFAQPGTDIWRLRGVVSLAPYDRDANMCDVSLYVVFTDVAHYLDWIHQCINRY